MVVAPCVGWAAGSGAGLTRLLSTGPMTMPRSRRQRRQGSVSFGGELVVGPDVTLGQQVGDAHGPGAGAFADDDLEIGEVVEKTLPAPAARWHDPSVAVPHGDDRLQFVG